MLLFILCFVLYIMFSPLEQFDVIIIWPYFTYFLFFLLLVVYTFFYTYVFSWVFYFSVFSSLKWTLHLNLDIANTYLNLQYFDLSLTNLLFFILFVNLILFFIYMLIFRRVMVIPTKIQAIFEVFFIAFFQLINQQIGKKGYVYLPFFFFIFNYIFLCNFISMLPFSFAVTSHVFVVFFLSLSMCLGIFLTGLFINKLKFFKLFVPDVPLALYPLMLTIELASYCIKSLSLGIRLCANLISGHTLLHILFSIFEVLPSLLIGNYLVFQFLIFSIILGLCFSIILLEIGVAFLQAYVYILLLSMYLNDALHPDSH